MNKKILFIIPDEREVYEKMNVKEGAFHLPSLALAILGAISKEKGFTPKILDLSVHENTKKELLGTLKNFSPKYVGITCTTASFYQAIGLARQIKDYNPEIKILVGGPHVSSLPEETLKYECFDYVFIGESEISFAQFLENKNPDKINGIAFKRKGKVHKSLNKNFLRNLDEFPFPDYGLYDLRKYRISSLQSKQNPVVWIETSRGCPFNCQVCNKIVHGQNFRPKSVERVIQEFEYFLKMGVREFHIADDGFTSDIARAERICDEIIKRKLKFTWSCVNGLRVDRVSKELFRKMKLAGCYRISFGIESGNQEVLNKLGKRILLSDVEKAVNMAREEGIEVFGFFMFGFENETEDTMKDTIRFAKKLKLDLAKASIIIPFPGCPLYDHYKHLGLIYESGDYRKFNMYAHPGEVYRHPSLKWDVIEKYQKKFFRSFYLNPNYVSRRFLKSLKNRTLLYDAKVALKTKWN